MSEVAEIRENLKTQYPELTEEEIKLLARYKQTQLCIKRYHASDAYKQKRKQKEAEQKAKTKELLAKLAAKQESNNG